MNRAILGMFLVFAVEQSFAWGQTGHRVIGLVASHYLSSKAEKRIEQILDGESLAMAGTWMDEVRANNQYDFMTDWHWVTVPDGVNYAEMAKNPNGDIIEAINRVIKNLKGKSLSQREHAEQIKILVHLVADLHQPLHIGTGEDRGGNDTKVKWLGRTSNLHRVWDNDMIDNTKLSYTEFGSALPKPTRMEISKLQNSNVLDWVRESVQLRKQVYAIGDRDLGYDYAYQNMDILRQRLLAAGIRLAGLLNEIYG